MAQIIGVLQCRLWESQQGAVKVWWEGAEKEARVGNGGAVYWELPCSWDKGRGELFSQLYLAACRRAGGLWRAIQSMQHTVEGKSMLCMVKLCCVRQTNRYGTN